MENNVHNSTKGRTTQERSLLSTVPNIFGVLAGWVVNRSEKRTTVGCSSSGRCSVLMAVSIVILGCQGREQLQQRSPQEEITQVSKHITQGFGCPALQCPTLTSKFCFLVHTLSSEG